MTPNQILKHCCDRSNANIKEPAKRSEASISSIDAYIHNRYEPKAVNFMNIIHACGYDIYIVKHGTPVDLSEVSVVIK